MVRRQLSGGQLFLGEIVRGVIFLGSNSLRTDYEIALEIYVVDFLESSRSTFCTTLLKFFAIPFNCYFRMKAKRYLSS